MNPIHRSPLGKGDSRGKGDWVLRTKEFPDPADVGASGARWKGHRVLPTDEEISLAQTCYSEACESGEGGQPGIAALNEECDQLRNA